MEGRLKFRYRYILPDFPHISGRADEAYRRRILTQLNRGEARHGLSRAVFYGRRGEVRQRYREGQEEQLGALGLVVNAIILWNTYYMDAAVDLLRSNQMAIDIEITLNLVGMDDLVDYSEFLFEHPTIVQLWIQQPIDRPIQLFKQTTE